MCFNGLKKLGELPRIIHSRQKKFKQFYTRENDKRKTKCFSNDTYVFFLMIGHCFRLYDYNEMIPQHRNSFKNKRFDLYGVHKKINK